VNGTLEYNVFVVTDSFDVFERDFTELIEVDDLDSTLSDSSNTSAPDVHLSFPSSARPPLVLGPQLTDRIFDSVRVRISHHSIWGRLPSLFSLRH